MFSIEISSDDEGTDTIANINKKDDEDLEIVAITENIEDVTQKNRTSSYISPNQLIFDRINRLSPIITSRQRTQTPHSTFSTPSPPPPPVISASFLPLNIDKPLYISRNDMESKNDARDQEKEKNKNLKKVVREELKKKVDKQFEEERRANEIFLANLDEEADNETEFYKMKGKMLKEIEAAVKQANSHRNMENKSITELSNIQKKLLQAFDISDNLNIDSSTEISSGTGNPQSLMRREPLELPVPCFKLNSNQPNLFQQPQFQCNRVVEQPTATVTIPNHMKFFTDSAKAQFYLSIPLTTDPTSTTSLSQTLRHINVELFPKPTNPLSPDISTEISAQMSPPKIPLQTESTNISISRKDPRLKKSINQDKFASNDTIASSLQVSNNASSTKCNNLTKVPISYGEWRRLKEKRRREEQEKLTAYNNTIASSFQVSNDTSSTKCNNVTKVSISYGEWRRLKEKRRREEQEKLAANELKRLKHVQANLQQKSNTNKISQNLNTEETGKFEITKAKEDFHSSKAIPIEASIKLKCKQQTSKSTVASKETTKSQIPDSVPLKKKTTQNILKTIRTNENVQLKPNTLKPIEHKRKQLENSPPASSLPLETVNKKKQASISIQKSIAKQKNVESQHTEELSKFVKTFNNVTTSQKMKIEKNRNKDSSSKPKRSKATIKQSLSNKATIKEKQLKSELNKKAMDRELKQLECLVKGFDSIQSLMPKTINGKRRSSIAARKAIAEQQSLEAKHKKDILQSKQDSNKSTEQLVHFTKSVPADISTKPKHRKVIRKDRNKRNTTQKSSNTLERELKQLKCLIKGFEEITDLTSKNIKSQRLSNVVESNFELNSAPSNTEDSKIIKNINHRMTERNCEKCVLCNSSSKDLTNHYILEHNTESYVSRLTWEELDDWEQEINFAKLVSSKDNEHLSVYTVKCPFCPEDSSKKTATFSNLYKHFSQHTGEYAFKCKKCGIQQAFRKDIKFHQKQTSCISAGVDKLYQYKLNRAVIFMYLCAICNFVQLNEENIFKHLREQHDKLTKDSRLVREYTLTALLDRLIKKEELNTLSNICQTSDHDNLQVENIPIEIDENFNTNEPVLEDILIKNENRQLNTKLLDDHNELIYEQNLRTTVLEANRCATINNFESIEIDQLPLNFENQPTEQLPIYFASSEMTLENSAKKTLHTFTAKTGIFTELLYKCSCCGSCLSSFMLWLNHMNSIHNLSVANCVHCVEKMELPLIDFEKHFKTHSIHLYLCFHCQFTCVDRDELFEHVSIAHAELLQWRIEHIPCNLTNSFYIIIEKNLLKERFEFLNKLNETFQTQDNWTTAWLADRNDSWLKSLKLPEFCCSISFRECLFPKCEKQFTYLDELLEHTRSHNKLHDDFKCVLCAFICKKGDPFRILVEHNFLHSECIFLCCICSKFYCTRNNVSKHIYHAHQNRDVPILVLKCSTTEVQIELEFIFASEAISFTTIKDCFFECARKDLSSEAYDSHLQNYHALKLIYFCNNCDENLSNPILCLEHHNFKHKNDGQTLKIRGQMAFKKGRKISIQSVQPLRICLFDDNYGRYCFQCDNSQTDEQHQEHTYLHD